MTSVDIRGTRIFLYRLTQVNEKYKEKEAAQQRVEEGLRRIKSLNVPKIREELQKLEQHIEEAINTEKRLHDRQTNQENDSRSVKERLQMIENKLEKYIETKISKAKNKIDTEEKTRRDSKEDIKEEIRKHLRNVESIYYELKQKGETKEIYAIGKRIKAIKEKI